MSEDNEEQLLAEQLRSICTPFGDERRSRLAESSEIFLKMGRLYSRKAATATGMAQKLDLIKSAALLYGARVRYRDILKDFRKSNEVYAAIVEMEKTLHRACEFGKFDESLAKISKKISGRLKLFRRYDRKAVSRIKKIDRAATPAVRLHAEQKRRISQVEDIMNKSTENYTALMKVIANKCTKFLGPPPCKFALAGLGSLARKEITLYSDFEHVIVLENGIQFSPNLDDVREYFRWFTTIFQVIIIGLGETFIRSIGIKSINNLYSEDKKLNWYYDVFTPSGVSYDGMVPHSCNNPLGRQELTKDKRHIVELIQPAGEMAKFLTSAQHLKNGYYVKDVLSRTCFLYGDRNVYRDFRRLSNEILAEEPMHDVIMEQVKNLRENVNISVKRLYSSLPVGVDIKSSFYRPVTVLLAFWARINRFQSCSSFDIVSEIERTTHNVQDAHMIRYAVAIACEIRLKAYIIGGHQRHHLLGREVDDIVGLQCAVECMTVISKISFQIDSLSPKKCKAEGEEFSLANATASGSNDLLGESQLYLQLKCQEEAKRILRKKLIEHSGEEPSKIACIHYNLVRALYLQAELSESERTNLYSEAEEHISKVIEVYPLAKTDGIIVDIICTIYSYLGRNKEGLDVINGWFDSLSPAQYQNLGNNVFSMRRLQVNMMRLSMKPSEVIDLCEEALPSSDLFSELCFTFGIGDSHLELGNIKKGADILNQLVKRSEQEASILGREWLLLFLDEVLGAQLRHELWTDAYLTQQTVEVCLESMVGGPPRLKENLVFTMAFAKCLLVNARNETNLEKRIDMMLKAADIFLSFLGKDEYAHSFLNLVLRSIFDFITDNFSTSSSALEGLSSFYPKLPDAVNNDFAFRQHLLNMLYALMQYFCAKIAGGYGPDIRNEFMLVAKTFRSELMHPCLFRLVMIMHYTAPPEATYVLDADSKAAFLVEYSTSRQSRESILFNKALVFYTEGKTHASAHLLWFILAMYKPRCFITGICSKVLLQVVLTHAYVPIQEQLNPDFFMQRHCFRENVGMKEVFNDAIYNFGKLDYKSSSITFWRLLFVVETESVIRSRCIEMLFHSILLKQLTFREYDVNFFRRYLSLIGSGKRLLLET